MPPKGLSPRGTTPRRHFCAQTLGATGFPGGERRCRRGASLFQNCFLGSALLLAKNSVVLPIFNYEIASTAVAFEKHLLVDGANILHAWPDLQALAARDKNAARAQLSQTLRALHDTEGWRVTLVFDGRGAELVVEQPGEHATFAHVFTPSALTADSVIEQLVGGAADPAACTVATADRAEQQTVSALGAAWCTPDELRAWCHRAAGRQAGQVAEMRRANDRTWRRKDVP
jgi:predicted RNA-binding protein with PIN domain